LIIEGWGIAFASHRNFQGDYIVDSLFCLSEFCQGCCAQQSDMAMLRNTQIIDRKDGEVDPNM
jgi:hypothetical protein